MKTVLLSVLLASNVYASPELHIVKNDGMNSHEVYQCKDSRTCYELYNTKWFYDKNINCATQMWIERDNKIIMRLKGARR